MEKEKEIAIELENINKTVDGYKQEVERLNKELAEKGATLGQIQDEVKELQANNTALKVSAQSSKSVSQMIADGIKENAQKFESISGSTKRFDGAFEVKTVANISSSNLASDNYVNYLDWRAGMRPLGQIRFRDLVRTVQSDIDFVQFPRHNVPTGEGSFAKITSEGGTKPQVDYDFTMVSLTLKPIAGIAICSRQSLRNIRFLQSYLPETMLEDLLDTEDQEFGNALVAAATGSSTTSLTAKPEKLIAYVTNLYKKKFAFSAMAMDPDLWQTLLVFRPGTDNPYSLPGGSPINNGGSVVAVDGTGGIRILGKPIYPVNWLTGGRVIVGDWNKAAIAESEGLRFDQSDSHASLFATNEIAFRLERTEELAIFRPDAFVTAVP